MFLDIAIAVLFRIVAGVILGAISFYVGRGTFKELSLRDTLIIAALFTLMHIFILGYAPTMAVVIAFSLVGSFEATLAALNRRANTRAEKRQ